MRFQPRFHSSNFPQASRGGNLGAVLIEFSFAVPMILLMFVGLLGLAQLLSSLVQVAQDAYLVTYVSAESGSATGAAAAQKRFQLLNLMSTSKSISSSTLPTPIFNTSSTASGGLPGRAVSARISANIKGIFSSPHTGLTLVAPIVVNGSSMSGSTSQFNNIAGGAAVPSPTPTGTTPPEGGGGGGGCSSGPKESMGSVSEEGLVVGGGTSILCGSQTSLSNVGLAEY